MEGTESKLVWEFMFRDESHKTMLDRGSWISFPNGWSILAWRTKEEGEAPLIGTVYNFPLHSIWLGEDTARYDDSSDKRAAAYLLYHIYFVSFCLICASPPPFRPPKIV